MMKSKVYIFLITILIHSCKSHKIFYAYEDNDSYAALELSNKNTNLNYWCSSKKTPYKLIVADGYKPIYDAIELRLNSVITINISNKIDGCVSFKYDEEGFEYNTDSINKNKIVLQSIGSIDCFKKNNITWFPPYMKRVKKIDYSKFPEDIREAVKALDNENNSLDKIEHILKNN